MNIISVETAAYIPEIRTLFREYEAELGVDLCFQSFEEELASLPGKYSPPEGALLLGVDGDQVIGCVAVRRLHDKTCEMKRLYVRPQFRNQGVGRLLAEQIIARAREAGYQLMYLDTLKNLTEALLLYRSLGFQDIDPYYHNPLEGVVYMYRDLLL